MEPRRHEDLRMAGEATTWVAVTPEVAYATVTDLARMGEWSPENRGGEWVDAVGAVLGAMFRGRNDDGQNEWDTIVTVIEADVPARFAFCVAPPGEVGTIWRYRFDAEGEGTAVTEAFEWHWTALPDEGFRGRVGRTPIEQAAAMVAFRERHLQQQIEATLARLKQTLETRGNR